MRCIHCEEEIESDDNFCWKCGHWTARGYTFLKSKENVDKIYNGDVMKQTAKCSTLILLFLLGLVSFMVMSYIRGDDLYRPIAYLKKQITSYIYGYNSTLMKTDNKYNRTIIDTYEEAIDYIKKDFDKQSYLCDHNLDLYFIESDLEKNQSITSVSFCDMSIEEANKIKSVIEKMYQLFPNIKGALTNITISNATTNSEYIARFQPMYQFINVSENINDYNKVNKTQILLNSYYFLNNDILSTPVENIVGKNWYVEDATWESTVSHEIGHYISFVSFLKENDINNITFVTAENCEKIDNLLKSFDSGIYSEKILTKALNNYNQKYSTNLNLEQFALTISNYANAKNKNGKLIADETIAEAIHDYYLHGNNMKLSSFEIVSVIKEKLR